MRAGLIIFVLLFLWQTSFPRPLSVALDATVSASSFFGDDYSVQNINDNIIAVHGQGNWLAKGKIPGFS